ncbi:MAG: hypothetical protein IIC75_03850 [Bacteroidetes bacterium]|nr:hypothetical protein [Bacteroidota bacterium]
MDNIKNTKSNQSRFGGMTPEKKLGLALRLYYSARELKEASLKTFHPDWNSKKIKEEVRMTFLYARS